MIRVMPQLLARTKWRERTPNVCVGDMGLVSYENRFGSDAWKLARVITVLPDSQGLVRTIEVQFGLSPGKTKPVLMIIPVQRFSPLGLADRATPEGNIGCLEEN